MQQVNLYREILKQQQTQSGISLTTVSLAALALLCLSFSVYLLWDISTTKTELHQAQLTLNQQQAQVNEILSKRSSQKPNTLLIAEIEQWQNSINEAEQTLELLAGKEAILTQGFSVYLQALANQFDPDVWLTAIHIDGQNRGLRLEGSTFKPQQIPQMLQRLQSEPAFKGQTFAKLAMQQSVKIAGQMDYTLSSSEQSLTLKDHAQ
ncbi:PilN domain-containing protein [Methylobacter psychrophilus]|uniref:PilN domain-containing protein n=1 Tax=Methylobacter psychrophilus TaxID=96941 RepID=UPI0021D488C0|nr:PilN domain-containing protein [Methylobacter psychrophilus]